MALELDTSAALRGTNELRRLVTAVVRGGDHDEADWVEWKGSLDLAAREGCFQVARAVLGMANRVPERAALVCEGLGYVIVGAEPGRLSGVDSVDPAKFDQIIEPYLGGAEGPRYTPTHVAVEGKTVLVVTVEAPKPGDRMYSLRREFPKYDPRGNEVGQYANGTVFVRKHGRTVQADASDLDALQARLVAKTAPGTDLEVSLVGDLPLSWLDAAEVGDAISAWVDRRREQLMKAARVAERRRHPEATGSTPDVLGLEAVQQVSAAFARQQADLRRMLASSSLGSALGEEDTRTFEEYVAEVDEWAERLGEAGEHALVARYFAAGHGVVALEIHNPTGRFLSDVEVEVHFEWEQATAAHEEPFEGDLPAPPRAYGEGKPQTSLFEFPLPRFPALDSRDYMDAISDVGRRTFVEDGSIRVRFEVGDLRQHSTDRSDDIYVVLGGRPEGGVLRGTWKATVRDVDGVLNGTIEVEIAEQPVEFRALLTEGDPDEE